MIKIIGVGKIRERFYEAAIEEYEKRLSSYVKLDIIRVADEKAPENISEKEAELVKEKEAERILKYIKDSDYVICLEIDGKEMSSEQFSSFLENLNISGISDIAFIIGGSIGLSEIVMQKADFHLSFSKMTYPHQLMSVILLEQIYRAYRIMRHEPYHK